MHYEHWNMLHRLFLRQGMVQSDGIGRRPRMAWNVFSIRSIQAFVHALFI